MKKQRRNELLLQMIAEKLVGLRCERGLSQEIVYEDTEIHMGRVERGEYNLTLSTLAELCDYYHVSMHDFFNDIPNP